MPISNEILLCFVIFRYILMQDKQRVCIVENIALQGVPYMIILLREGAGKPLENIVSCSDTRFWRAETSFLSAEPSKALASKK